MKILNLYAGIGGNRKRWGEEHEITAVEINPTIAKVYQDLYPNDEVIVGDAHEFLLKYYDQYDFIWSSPPCPSHSRVRKATTHQNPPIYPDMKLYEEILFLEGYFAGEWVVENVISWYQPLIRPYEYQEHYYWASFVISGDKRADRFHDEGIEALQRLKEIDLSKYKFEGISKVKILRNAVEPKAGKRIFDMAFNNKQTRLSI